MDSIRGFDAETQRSGERHDKLELLPAREFSLGADSIRDFRRRFRTRFEGDLTRMPLYRDVGDGLAPAGVEYYLPLFFEATASLFDYLPAGAVVALAAGHEHTLAAAWTSIQERFEERRYDIEHPVLDPGEVFLAPDEWLASAARFPTLLLGGASGIDAGDAAIVVDAHSTEASPLRLDQRRDESLARIRREPGVARRPRAAGSRSPGRRELLLELLRPRGVSARVVAGWGEFLAGDMPLAITVAPLSSGVALSDPTLTIYADEQLFGERVRQERRRRRSDRDPARIIQQLADLRPGAPVVHEDYGVGRYLGLTTMDAGGLPAEFLVLEYADGDKLYVPVQSLRTDQPLHRRSARVRAAAQARRRPVVQGPQPRGRAGSAMPPPNCSTSTRAAPRARATPSTVDDAQLQTFAAGFPFEETADQAAAIAQVVADLRSPKPMDRLVCGDVGFGKTEVALRAAFVAVQGGKQVAVLVPTTLLAQQHYQTFADRFADWPVRVELLSRFRADAQSARPTVAGLAEGKRRHRRRHAPAAAARRALQGPRAADHRRGAPLRRARQGAAEGAARRSRRPHAHGDADPAHAATWRSAACATCR